MKRLVALSAFLLFVATAKERRLRAIYEQAGTLRHAYLSTSMLGDFEKMLREAEAAGDERKLLASRLAVGKYQLSAGQVVESIGTYESCAKMVEGSRPHHFQE